MSHSSLSGLRSWTSPALPSSSFSASQFRVFLPPKNKDAVGDTWWVIPSELNIFTGYLPNNRYNPPTPKGKEVPQNSSPFVANGDLPQASLIWSLVHPQVLIHSLLSMFHPRPFVKSRFAPQGAVACIRASNDFYFDIVFRWGVTAVQIFLLLRLLLQNPACFLLVLTNIKIRISILMVMCPLAGSQAFILKSACRDGFLQPNTFFPHRCIIIVC